MFSFVGLRDSRAVNYRGHSWYSTVAWLPPPDILNCGDTYEGELAPNP